MEFEFGVSKFEYHFNYLAIWQILEFEFESGGNIAENCQLELVEVTERFSVVFY